MSEHTSTQPLSQSDAPQPDAVQREAPPYGLLAEYTCTSDLVAACQRVRDAGYSRWDTYTPFPVHGIERAMGIRMTALPWIVLSAGLAGAATGTWLQWWTNTVDYGWIVSGKPFWSLPANVPVIFEMAVLFAATAALVGMLVLNGLPHPSHPLDLRRRFARSTNDRFFVVVEAADARYSQSDTQQLLESTGPCHVEIVPQDTVTQARIPAGWIYASVIVAVAALLPFALIAKARASQSTQPRIHPIADMDWQPKFKAQRANSMFDDGRATRLPPEGTIAHGELQADDHLFRGKRGANWARTFPEQIAADTATMERGRERFEIFCAPCHGLTGDGQGMVTQRAQLREQPWVPPTDIHMDNVRQQPVGQLFNTITNGIRNMAGYGSQISPEDRWAIVMYLRALQQSRNANSSEVPPELRAELK